MMQNGAEFLYDVESGFLFRHGPLLLEQFCFDEGLEEDIDTEMGNWYEPLEKSILERRLSFAKFERFIKPYLKQIEINLEEFKVFQPEEMKLILKNLRNPKRYFSDKEYILLRNILERGKARFKVYTRQNYDIALILGSDYINKKVNATAAGTPGLDQEVLVEGPPKEMIIGVCVSSEFRLNIIKEIILKLKEDERVPIYHLWDGKLLWPMT